MRMGTVIWQRTPDDFPAIPQPESWQTAAPGDVGLDGALLESLAERIAKGELPNVHSLLVTRDGKLAFERYFAGTDALWAFPLGRVAFEADTVHDVRSISKSVVGALVGIAHAEGALPDLDAPLASLFPEYATGRESDLAGRTLRHALTMSAGLSWDELTHPYWDPRNDEHGMWAARDPLEYALSRKPVAAPGERFAYNGGLPTVLAAAIERATRKSLDRYAIEKLWCPLGVTRAEWVTHESGMVVAASGLRLRPRDLARFGQMMLDDGRFAGREVVPADYARASVATQIATQGGGFPPGYGYLWWIAGLPAASGNGGQRVVLHKAARTVIVTTAGLYDSPQQGPVPQQVIESVLRAIRS